MLPGAAPLYQHERIRYPNFWPRYTLRPNEGSQTNPTIPLEETWKQPGLVTPQLHSPCRRGEVTLPHRRPYFSPGWLFCYLGSVGMVQIVLSIKGITLCCRYTSLSVGNMNWMKIWSIKDWVVHPQRISLISQNTNPKPVIVHYMWIGPCNFLTMYNTHVKMKHYMINKTQYTVIWFFIYTTYRKNNTLVTLNPIYIL